ncbi:MAG TPA: glycosyltransferase family 2 protein [Bacteroidia bacterium]|jgi:GT2 family glycosyltransferase
MKKIAVVILNWNGRGFLENFLPYVLKCNSNDAEIILADNASTDDSVEFVKRQFPSVTIIRNKGNGGYAKGYNDALRGLPHEYFVLLNSDVEVTRDWLQPVIALMDSDANVAACQPKILSYQERKQFEYAGAAGGFIDKFGFPFCRGRMFDRFEEDSGQYDDEREIFWATGACLFVRASAYREAGGLDEDFFAHMEEIDLCWRMKNIGYKVMYCPRSHVYHVGGGTLNKLNPQKTYLNFRNNLVLLCKNHAPGYFLLKMFLRMSLDGIAGWKFLLGGQVRHLWAVLRAHVSFYWTLGHTLRKRREMKKRIKVYSTSAIYRGSVVLEYYLRGKKKFSLLDPRKFNRP